MKGMFESLRCELRHRGSNVHVTMVQLPGMNTPQFDHCLSKMPRHPMPVPPIFEPEVAARSIYWAAHHRRRELYVGFPTVYTIIGNKLAPWLAERYLARTAVDGQQTEERFDGTAAANLFEPVDSDHDEGAHGGFDDQAHRRSAQAWLSRHRLPSGLAAAALGAAGAGAALAELAAPLEREPLGQARGERHDRQRRVGRALRRHHAAVGDEQVRHLPGPMVGVDHAALGIGAHPAAAHQVGVAVGDQDVLRARRPRRCRAASAWRSAMFLRSFSHCE